MGLGGHRSVSNSKPTPAWVTTHETAYHSICVEVRDNLMKALLSSDHVGPRHRTRAIRLLGEHGN